MLGMLICRLTAPLIGKLPGDHAHRSRVAPQASLHPTTGWQSEGDAVARRLASFPLWRRYGEEIVFHPATIVVHGAARAVEIDASPPLESMNNCGWSGGHLLRHSDKPGSFHRATNVVTNLGCHWLIDRFPGCGCHSQMAVL
jgi:hypothetical protein